MVWALKSMTKDAMVVKNQVDFFHVLYSLFGSPPFHTDPNEHPKQKRVVYFVWFILCSLGSGRTLVFN